MTHPISIYYQKIIALVLDTHAQEFGSALAGHCMKITGFNTNELDYLFNQIKESHPHIDTFIIDDKHVSDRTITATKLIELRNKQEKPLLVLIPANSRTAAEDSYGNATFKEISLDGIESQLMEQLLNEIPASFRHDIETILGFVNDERKTPSKIVNYTLKLSEVGFNDENIGNYLYFLDLIPDSELLQPRDKIRSKLHFNMECLRILSSFSKPTNERINELPLKGNTIQKEIYQFTKDESQAKSIESICFIIHQKYPNLNFSNWPLPDLNLKHIQVHVEFIDSKEFKFENGGQTLYIENNNIAKVKIRFSTSPSPKEIESLKYFSIILMAVGENGGEEIRLLRKTKNTNSTKSYRDVTVELDGASLENGTYFLKVLAENEHGNILNLDDNFKSDKHQQNWENIQKANPDASKNDFPYKRTSDSDDFYFVVEDERIERDDELQRKDKLNNVLQAYFKYKSSKLKKGEELNTPKPEADSNVWLENERKKIESTFFIHYSSKHNYQINIPTKLRLLQGEFLNFPLEFGTLLVDLPQNEASLDMPIIFSRSPINEIISPEILHLRANVFNKIKSSNATGNGIFETADIFNFIDDIKDYIESLTNWIGTIHRRIKDDRLTQEEKVHLQDFLVELQNLDIVKVKTTLPNNESVEALVLSPLHPLRLAWSVQLFDLFKDWEEKTLAFEGHKTEWYRELDKLFDGNLFAENNPLVLLDSTTLTNFQYSGELAFGYGIYLASRPFKNFANTTSVTRQLKYYFTKLFNIDKKALIENEISQKLVIRHLRNYLFQHPYTDKLIINLFNAGDANIFAIAFTELEKETLFKRISYEVRVFKGTDQIIEHGEGLRNLLNPEYNISEEAEAFSQSSKNRLFPKLRFSINEITDYLQNPNLYAAHISFLISPFPLFVELIKPSKQGNSFSLNGLITTPITVFDSGKELIWKTYISTNNLHFNKFKSGEVGISLFSYIQSFVASGLTAKYTESIPSKVLRLTEKDKVLISHLHDFSDWVITFDKNLGPEIFDQPTKHGEIPFLLDYIPGEETSGIASYLTTRPTSEIIGLLGPHFNEFGIKSDDEEKIKILLEDLRAISSSLILQLNSSKNKAFEVIGSAFTKRILEKKGFLENAFLIPIDLHQYFFEGGDNESKSRADNLLISMNPDTKEINITVIEIKCRKALLVSEKDELKTKMSSQINNTIEAIKKNFDTESHLSFDRLDRELKNIEFKSFLSFYLDRAYRYNFLTENSYSTYSSFLEELNLGFKLSFQKLGFIFDLENPVKHKKEVVSNDLTFFTFGGKLIEEILDTNSDLNTRRLEEKELTDELKAVLYIKDSPIKVFENFVDTKTVVQVDPLKDLPKINLIFETPKVQEKIEEVILTNEEVAREKKVPNYDILVGKDSNSPQFGVLGKSIHGKKIALDLNDTNTISLFGVQGGGKSYTIGTISEMVLREFDSINLLPSPLAGVIFHYSESMDYAPEFTSMIYPNDKESELRMLKEQYGAEPENIADVVILTPQDKLEERQAQYPSINVRPIAFNSQELNVQDWLSLLGAIGNDSTYIKQLKAIMKENRRNITLTAITTSVEDTPLLTNSQKTLARQRLNFASDYINDTYFLRDILKPERLIIVDMRDEFITKDEALGLFVIMLNIFSGVKEINGKHFNKFIVFDEAHKYMDNKDLTANIVTAIREMRHKGVSIMIASQDPPSLPNEIIELSSIVLIHKFNSPQWLKHIQKSITQLNSLTPNDMSALMPGEGFLWATKASEKSITTKPIKIQTRPRVTKHGGATIQAIGDK